MPLLRGDAWGLVHRRDLLDEFLVVLAVPRLIEFELLVQILLVEEWQKRDPPTQSGFPVECLVELNPGRVRMEKYLESVVVAKQPDPDLEQVLAALGEVGGLTALGCGRA